MIYPLAREAQNSNDEDLCQSRAGAIFHFDEDMLYGNKARCGDHEGNLPTDNSSWTDYSCDINDDLKDFLYMHQFSESENDSGNFILDVTDNQYFSDGRDSRNNDEITNER